MKNKFHLIDLISQAPKVEELICGKSIEEKILWLSCHIGIKNISPKSNELNVYLFESSIGIKAALFFDNDKIRVIIDNTVFETKI